MELKRNVSSGLLWFAACFATVHFVRLFLKSCIDFTFFNFEPYFGPFLDDLVKSAKFMLLFKKIY
jgi:hypothetical protein